MWGQGSLQFLIRATNPGSNDLAWQSALALLKNEKDTGHNRVKTLRFKFLWGNELDSPSLGLIYQVPYLKCDTLFDSSHKCGEQEVVERISVRLSCQMAKTKVNVSLESAWLEGH